MTDFNHTAFPPLQPRAIIKVFWRLPAMVVSESLANNVMPIARPSDC